MHAGTRRLCALAMLSASTPARAAEPSADAGELPSYTAPLAPVADPVADSLADGSEPTPEPPRLREVPEDGRGRQTVGAFGLVGAAALGAGTVGLALEGFPTDVWGTTLTVTVGVGAAASLLMWDGARRKRRYRSWAASESERPPVQGKGLVAAGGTMLIVGAAGVLFGTIFWPTRSVSDNPERPSVSRVFPAMVGLGVASLAAGTATMIVGVRRHRRFQAWRRVAPLELTPLVAPIGAPVAGGGAAVARGPVGAQFGVVGRF